MYISLPMVLQLLDGCISRIWILSVHMVLRLMSVQEISLDVLQKANEVFADKLGTLNGYVQKIILKLNTVPVQHKLRCIPLVARKEVRKLLDEMRSKCY